MQINHVTKTAKLKDWNWNGISRKLNSTLWLISGLVIKILLIRNCSRRYKCVRTKRTFSQRNISGSEWSKGSCWIFVCRWQNCHSQEVEGKVSEFDKNPSRNKHLTSDILHKINSVFSGITWRELPRSSRMNMEERDSGNDPMHDKWRRELEGSKCFTEQCTFWFHYRSINELKGIFRNLLLFFDKQ